MVLLGTHRVEARAKIYDAWDCPSLGAQRTARLVEIERQNNPVKVIPKYTQYLIHRSLLKISKYSMNTDNLISHARRLETIAKTRVN